MNKALFAKLTYLKNNLDKVHPYAGTWHRKNFRPCKICKGKGFIERLNYKNDITGYFCKCVIDNVEKELEESLSKALTKESTVINNILVEYGMEELIQKKT